MLNQEDKIRSSFPAVSRSLSAPHIFQQDGFDLNRFVHDLRSGYTPTISNTPSPSVLWKQPDNNHLPPNLSFCDRFGQYSAPWDLHQKIQDNNHLYPSSQNSPLLIQRTASTPWNFSSAVSGTMRSGFNDCPPSAKPGEASPTPSSAGDQQSLEGSIGAMEDDQRWFDHFDHQANVRKIWIGGLAKETTEQELRQWLNSFGTVDEMSLVRDETGISKGFAYVTFLNAESASAMIRSEPVQFGIRSLSVKPAIPKEIMNMNKIYISSLPDVVTTDQVCSYFSQFGKVHEVVMKLGKNRRFAFVRFADASSIDLVFATPAHYIQGKMIFCERARCSSKKKDDPVIVPPRAKVYGSPQIVPQVQTLPSLNSKALQNFPNNNNTCVDSRVIQRPSPSVRPIEIRDDQAEGAQTTSNVEKRIWIGGISKSMTDRELVEYFTAFGDVEQAFIVTDDRSRSKGFAYVTFVSCESAARVLASENLKVGDRTVTVKAALPEAVMNKNKIYVCGLGDHTTQKELFDYFRMFGTVVEAIIKDAGSHRFAFVRFESRVAVEHVFDKASHVIGGKVVHCERAYGSRRGQVKGSSDVPVPSEMIDVDELNDVDSANRKKQQRKKWITK
eukprot:TRINITY_DN24861_c0_g2_i1.p1 TRINITY_DN24861_c0_g2~~TRINITY_DN24861_c0_g2_i1.p1  ORF type:complete len:614 (+),score=139.11 TRINITY_DN24861_c0_g2_i1:187-2028(+)